MSAKILAAVLLPLLGTGLGAGAVFFLTGTLSPRLQRGLSGFAAGVMTAASVWSLLLPAIDRSAHLGGLAFFPAAAGVWLGIFFLLLLQRYLPLPDNALPRDTGLLLFSVTLHNLPEGMAVGAALAGWLWGQEGSFAAAAALSLGIALQNLPEGAILSMPLKAAGMPRRRAFWYGALSGAVEPVGALATLALSAWLVPALPWFLAFAAGAMLYVVVTELVPRISGDAAGILWFTLGFTLMMGMDVALG